MKRRLSISLEGRDLGALLDAVARWPWFGGSPVEIAVDDQDAAVSSRWLDQLHAANGYAWAAFAPIEVPPSQKHMVSISKGLVVCAWAPAAFGGIEDVLDLLAGIDFDVCSVGDVYADEWAQVKSRPRRGFANKHNPLGLACAFRGRGHDRLVSRRWLDFGPWRTLRGTGDVSLVQFHDLAADADAALAQALPGHERMGISEEGGFIQGPSAAGKGIKYSPWEQFPEGLYDAASRTLEVVVAPGREIAQGEMLDACAYRLMKRDDKATPIERVAYVFMTEGAARAHLHELWLRELEVWTVEGGQKRRLDADYDPKPSKPDWVRRVEGSS